MAHGTVAPILLMDSMLGTGSSGLGSSLTRVTVFYSWALIVSDRYPTIERTLNEHFRCHVTLCSPGLRSVNVLSIWANEFAWLYLTKAHRSHWIKHRTNASTDCFKRFLDFKTTLAAPLFTRVCKWLPVNLMVGCNPAMSVLMDWHAIQGGEEMLLVASC